MGNRTNVSNSINWANAQSEATIIATKAAKLEEKIEKERAKNGWRWVKIDIRNKLFVPCDKNGEPTDKGKIMIEKFKNNI